MVVLYVEDDLDDIDMFKYIVHRIDSSITITNVRNGEEALEFLNKSVNLPDIIFLDINMPIMDGLSCLKSIKASHRLKCIPVVMYSTCILPQDAELCHQLSVLACLQKPNSIKEGVNQICEFLKN